MLVSCFNNFCHISVIWDVVLCTALRHAMQEFWGVFMGVLAKTALLTFPEEKWSYVYANAH